MHRGERTTHRPDPNLSGQVVAPRRRGRAGAAVGVALMLVVAACTPWSGFERVGAGEPGATGPCGLHRREVANPAEPGRPLVLLEPAGDGTPWTGGTCGDGGRPLAVLVHGYGGSDDAVYGGLVHHLVGNGFVVVFPRYGNELDVPRHRAAVDAAVVAGVAASGRVDTSRVGVVGHSMGGGMSPWVLQRAAERGWGASATWLVMFAPFYADGHGAGPVEVPPATRAAVVAYDRDAVVDARIGIELFHALTVDPARKDHVTVRSDLSRSPWVVADHWGPVGFLDPGVGGLSVDHLDRWSAYRTVDAVAGCSLDGRWCGTDLGRMGTRPDGTPVVPAVVGDQPGDVGPRATYECDAAVNPRPCP